MAFVNRRYVNDHIKLPKCAGASILTVECDVVGPGRTLHKRSRQSCGNVASTGKQMANTINNFSNNNIVIVCDTLGDLVRAGTVTEADLIREIIMQRPDLRQQLRTVENIPAAIFRVTNGRDGPLRLRNVKMDGSRVAELRSSGVVVLAKRQFCKDMAAKLVDLVRQIVASIDDSAPPEVQEWACDMRCALVDKTYGKYDYPTALALYRTASAAFKKLPQEARERVMHSVTAIGVFIAPEATF